MVGQWHYYPSQIQCFLDGTLVVVIAERHGGAGDAQTRHKFLYAQYMDNLHEHIMWPRTHPNMHCTLCPLREIDTWPHLLSKCTNRYIHGLHIFRYNKAIHDIASILFSSHITKCHTIIIACTQNNQTCDNPPPVRPMGMLLFTLHMSR